jgi:hypothetical protein
MCAIATDATTGAGTCAGDNQYNAGARTATASPRATTLGGVVITQAPLTCTAVAGDAVGRSAHLIDVGGQIKLSHSIQYIKHIAKSTFC